MKATTDTSIDFGQFCVLKAKLLEPGHGTITPWTYSNMEPLPQPSWGEVKYENRIFFVPLSLIFKGYQDFKEDIIHVLANDSSASQNTLPYMNGGDIAKAFAEEMQEVLESVQWDISIYDSLTQTAKFYRHTRKTWVWLKIMETFGIRIRWSTSVDTRNINILRLLAAGKVFIDYYYNNAYVGDADYVACKQILERDNGTLQYSKDDFKALMNVLVDVYYNVDYFTGAWDKPNHPNISNQESSYTIQDINNNFETTNTSGKSMVTNERSQGGDPAIMGMNGTATLTGVQSVTQYALSMMSRLSQFLKRNQLAGGDTLARLLARYGYAPAREQMKKSRLIGKVTWGMNVTPIFSSADTAASGGENLGAYAGYGFGLSGERGKDRFEFNTEEMGILLETITVVPVELYTQGIDAENFALTRLDLPTPEFDTVGVEPILKSELIRGTSFDEQINKDQYINNEIFGWVPRYAKYKEMRDSMAGNFTNRNWRTAYQCYTMMRLFDYDLNHNAIAHSKDFTKLSDGKMYDRIFYSTAKGVYDNFRIHHELTIEWWSWMKPLYDVYEWEHERGKEVDLIGNGPLAN